MTDKSRPCAATRHEDPNCEEFVGARRKSIENTIDDLVGSFLYYDRKEDECLPRGAIQAAIEADEITAQEIIDRFAEQLLRGL